jgi:hypothetical protein
MSLVQESLVQSLLGECDQLLERQEREAKEAVVHNLDQIYDLFRRNIRDAFLNYSLDVIIRFAEVAVEVPPSPSRSPSGSHALPNWSRSSLNACRPPTSSTSAPYW